MSPRTAHRPLEHRVALVTGGSRGIGAGITRKLASWGASVAVNYVDRPTPARQLAEELRAEGATVSLHRADVSDPEQVESLVQEVGARYGDLHILVHNAASTTYASLEETTLDQWQFVQDTNCRSAWLLAKHAVPFMRGRTGARLVTITNSTTCRVAPSSGAFAVAKAGLETLTRYLSCELAPHGIVVNGVRPGLVHTDVFDVRPDLARAAEHERAVTPWGPGHVSTVQTSADVVALLCLDEAAWISGQIITVDGGFQLWGGRRSP